MMAGNIAEGSAWEGEEGGKMMQCEHLVASPEAAQVVAPAELGEPGWAVMARMF